MAFFLSPRQLVGRFLKILSDTTTGGEWARQLPESVRHNLRAFFFDGVFASASDAITLTYFTLYLLALGASSAQVGLLSSLSNIVAVLVLLPGAMLSDRFGKRKRLVLLTGGGFTRLMLPVFALIPLVLRGPAAVYVVIVLKVLADGAGNLAIPAWVSMTADIIPLAWRGRYFGTRNLVMGICGMAITFLAGELITRSGSIQGYQWAFAAAFIIGILSSYSFSQIREPEAPVIASAAQEYTPASLWNSLRSDRHFLAFCLYNLAWNFSIMIAGPFFSVYQVNVLKASATMVGVLTISSSLASLPALRFFGPLADRLGNRRVMLITGLLIPLLPAAWIFTSEPWHGIPINIFGGFVWAGFGLAQFNMLLQVSPANLRARYSAIFQLTAALSNALGAALGGLITQHWGFHAVFLLSGLGRLLSMIMFIQFVRPPEDK